MNFAWLRVVAVAIGSCSLAFTACQYDVPITSAPTRKVQEGLLGDWTSADGTEKLKRRSLDDSIYIVYYDGEKPPPGPPIELRLAAEQVESELKSAGFALVSRTGTCCPINTSSRPNDGSLIGISNSDIFNCADFLNPGRRRLRPNLCAQRPPENRRIRNNRQQTVEWAKI